MQEYIKQPEVETQTGERTDDTELVSDCCNSEVNEQDVCSHCHEVCSVEPREKDDYSGSETE